MSLKVGDVVVILQDLEDDVAPEIVGLTTTITEVLTDGYVATFDEPVEVPSIYPTHRLGPNGPIVYNPKILTFTGALHHFKKV